MNNKCYKVLKLEHLKGLDYEVTILDESGLTQVLAVHEISISSGKGIR